ncbi:MAG TPA: phosphoglycerate kinase [Planctomycetes bacterium]|jgi:phosphoglycerate kinase|nr:phosphoglycerate kinase [Planctomycetota bacterium]HIL51654.1 phosphoglycerate kinase [Planctomycetota bacterium]
MNLKVPALETLDLKGRRVLLRVDFNVPLGETGEIGDDTRIRRALPTLRAVQAAGGQPILLSHLGRPGGEVVETLRLDGVGRRLAELFESPVEKLDESVGAEVSKAIDAAAPGTVMLLENVRFHPGETLGDPDLAAQFARLGDVFVNDAFGTSHRDHASVAGLARVLPSAAGELLQAELAAFERILDDPARPLVAILGGAKVSDKLTVIDALLDKVDAILVGGGMAYTFLAAEGECVGDSLLQTDQFDSLRAARKKAERLGVRLCLPVDHVVASGFSKDADLRTVEQIPEGWMALDIGPRTAELYSAEIAAARSVVWNGPMGVFEWESFQAGTETVGRAVASSEAYTVVGGGDSVAAVEQFGLSLGIDHISTGGGASLELLEGRELPGIAALLCYDDPR